MFQFPGFVPRVRPPSQEYQVFNLVGCPIQTSADQVLFADPRGFSQLTTSFIASG